MISWFYHFDEMTKNLFKSIIDKKKSIIDIQQYKKYSTLKITIRFY